MKINNKYTILYRSVSESEHLDILKNGCLRTVPGGYEGKCLALTHNHAIQFGTKLSIFDNLRYTIVKVKVSADVELEQFEAEGMPAMFLH